jgi:general secretion pathway protein G
MVVAGLFPTARCRFIDVKEFDGMSAASKCRPEQSEAGSDRRVGATCRENVLRCRGFTLLELLVVVAILGLLAAYVAPRYFSQLGKSETAVARAQIEAFDKALEHFRLDVGRFPTAEEGLAALTARPAGLVKWNGPYLRKAVPNDPWGRPYVYRFPGSGGDYDLVSYGRDGSPGGSGENADISNH